MSNQDKIIKELEKIVKRYRPAPPDLVASVEMSAEEVDKVVGANLRRLRKERGYSQQDVGDLFGITFQQVQKYENGTNRISCGKLYVMAGAFGVNINAFF